MSLPLVGQAIAFCRLSAGVRELGGTRQVLTRFRSGEAEKESPASGRDRRNRLSHQRKVVQNLCGGADGLQDYLDFSRHCYNGASTTMLDESIQELLSRSLGRIASANSLEGLEAVRVDALGRKAGLTQFSKEMGKLAPEERKHIGQLLNSARQQIEEALESKKQYFAEPDLRARLGAEWVDLTLPAPGPRRGHLHPRSVPSNRGNTTATSTSSRSWPLSPSAVR